MPLSSIIHGTDAYSQQLLPHRHSSLDVSTTFHCPPTSISNKIVKALSLIPQLISSLSPLRIRPMPRTNTDHQTFPSTISSPSVENQVAILSIGEDIQGREWHAMNIGIVERSHDSFELQFGARRHVQIITRKQVPQGDIIDPRSKTSALRCLRGGMGGGERCDGYLLARDFSITHLHSSMTTLTMNGKTEWNGRTMKKRKTNNS